MCLCCLSKQVVNLNTTDNSVKISVLGTHVVRHTHLCDVMIIIIIIMTYIHDRYYKLSVPTWEESSISILVLTGIYCCSDLYSGPEGHLRLHFSNSNSQSLRRSNAKRLHLSNSNRQSLRPYSAKR